MLKTMPGSSLELWNVKRMCSSLPGVGGLLPYQSGGGGAARAHAAHGEREIKKFMVTNRELLINLSNIYKCKVSPGGTFSLGHFLFNERENYQV